MAYCICVCHHRSNRPKTTLHLSIHAPFRGGGLVVVGSYVPKSSEQLQHLREMGGIEVCFIPCKVWGMDNGVFKEAGTRVVICLVRQGVERERGCTHERTLRAKGAGKKGINPPNHHTHTTTPIAHRRQQKQAVELQVDRVIKSKQAQNAEAARVRGEVEALLKAGKDVAVYTTRALRQVRTHLYWVRVTNGVGTWCVF